MEAQDQIRKWADSGGRKMGWIASALPVNQSTFSRWMMGHAIPSAVYRNRLADVTGIEIAREKESWK